MRRKKSSSTPKKRGKKQRTFLSLFIVAALAVTIGLPLTLKLNSTQTPSQEVAAAISTSVNIRSLTTSQSHTVESSTVSCEQSESFISTYKVGCWNKAEVTRNVISADLSKVSCVSITKIAQDAASYCNTQTPTKTPTPTKNTTGIRPPTPCKIAGAGDVDFDGYVTSKDVVLVQEFGIAKKTPTSSQLLRADINGTKTITSADLAAINAYSLGKIKTFPVCGTTPTPTYTPNNPWKTPTPTSTSITTVCPNFPGNGTQNVCITGSQCPTGYSVYGSATNNACGTGKLCCNK